MCLGVCKSICGLCVYHPVSRGGRARVKVCTAGIRRMHSVSVAVQRRWCDVLVQECIYKSTTLIRVRSSPGSIRCPPAPQLKKTKPRGPSCSPTAPRFCQAAGSAPRTPAPAPARLPLAPPLPPRAAAAAARRAQQGALVTPTPGRGEEEIPYKIAMVPSKKDHNKILNKFPFNLFDHSTLRGYELLKFDNKYSIPLIM